MGHRGRARIGLGDFDLAVVGGRMRIEPDGSQVLVAGRRIRVELGQARARTGRRVAVAQVDRGRRTEDRV